MDQSVPAFTIRTATLSDLDNIVNLEAQCFPPDEAASRATMEYRLKNAIAMFRVAETVEDKRIIGYVCGTCSSKDELTHDSMYTHDPNGALLCIHSVAVEPPLRRRGIATEMLKQYISYTRTHLPSIKRLTLITKAGNISLYERVGFKMIGPSKVVHGKDQWYEMSLDC